jgi:hypothetical protein
MQYHVASKELRWCRYYDNVYPVRNANQLHLAAFYTRKGVHWTMYIVNSDDQQVYTYHLSNGIRNESGSPCPLDDVICPMRFLLASEAPYMPDHNLPSGVNGRYEVLETSAGEGAWYFTLNEEVQMRYHKNYSNIPPYYLVYLNMQPFAALRRHIILSRHKDDQAHFIDKEWVTTTSPLREKYIAAVEHFKAVSTPEPETTAADRCVFWISLTGALTKNGYSLNFSIPGLEDIGAPDLALESIHIRCAKRKHTVPNYTVLRNLIDSINRHFKPLNREFKLVYATALVLGTRHSEHEMYYLSLRDPQFNEICGDILVEEIQRDSSTADSASSMQIVRVDTRWMSSCEGLFTNGCVFVDAFNMDAGFCPKYPCCTITPLSKTDQLILEDPVDKAVASFASSRYHCHGSC